jgi:hypothetical protein
MLVTTRRCGSLPLQVPLKVEITSLRLTDASVRLIIRLIIEVL